jgi:NTE family protein
MMMTVVPHIFGIFEGGGAKGVAHVGAFAAAEELGLRFAGVAGTSAGAIVATLIAAGFSARDIFDPDSRDRNILARNQSSIRDLLGDKNWSHFDIMRSVGRTLLDQKSLPGFLKVAVRHPRSIYHLVQIMLNYHGHFSTEMLTSFINRILRRRLREIYLRVGRSRTNPPEIIRFEDLDSANFPEHIIPLKIAVTNLATRSLDLFDCKRTPKAVVQGCSVLLTPSGMTGRDGG